MCLQPQWQAESIQNQETNTGLYVRELDNFFKSFMEVYLYLDYDYYYDFFIIMLVSQIYEYNIISAIWKLYNK